jgi:transcriptional regulator EpsA
MLKITPEIKSLEVTQATEYHRILSDSIKLKTHLDVLCWLQGDLQDLLPHEIMISAWGDYSTGVIRNDIISPISAVRSSSSDESSITPLILELFRCWNSFGNKPYAMNVGPSGFQIVDKSTKLGIKKYLKKMRSVMVHGIKDERGSHDSLYMVFTSTKCYTEVDRTAIGYILPHIDFSLRQIKHLPHQAHTKLEVLPVKTVKENENSYGLSAREIEVMDWVKLGKTNSEIGSILNISGFTVKNHMCRVFKKLVVSNRAQAVGRFNEILH